MNNINKISAIILVSFTLNASVMQSCKNKSSSGSDGSVVIDEKIIATTSLKKFEPKLPIRTEYDTIFFENEDSVNLNFITYYDSINFLAYQYGINSDQVCYYRNKESAIVIIKNDSLVYDDVVSKSDFEHLLSKEAYESVHLMLIVFKGYKSNDSKYTFHIYLNVPETDVRWVYEYSISQNMSKKIELIE